MSHILRKRGVRMPLQELPFRMLAMLLARPGEVVTREELKQELWSEEDFGEFDLGLNTAVKKLRQALDDSANTPRFIETIPKVGYKFLVPVAESPGPELNPVDSTDQTVNPVEALPPGAVVVQQRSQRALQAVAAVATLALLGVLAVHFTQAPPEKPVARFSFSPEGVGRPSISPDGKYILYTATVDGESSLWLRAIASELPRQLDRTEGVVRAFWSPDNLSIGFGTRTELKRMSIDGGIPITLCELAVSGGNVRFGNGSWSPDGETIVFASRAQLYEIPARGGQPEPLLKAGANGFDPHFLPAEAKSRALVYTTVGPGGPTDQRLAILNLESGEHRELGPGDEPVYSRSGHLVYGPSDVGGRGLWALPFSLETLEPNGEAFPIDTGGHWATVSRDGTLAYVDQTGAVANMSTLVWRNRDGELMETIGQPQNSMGVLALSPDGQRIAVRSTESGNLDIWIHDLNRSTKTRLTFDGATEQSPIWSPSGAEIVYTRIGTGGASLMRKAADGTGEAVVLIEADGYPFASDWSTDGRYLAYSELTSEANFDIGYVELQSNGETSEPVTFLSTPLLESILMFSPDGRFVAYVSEESGLFEVYVRPFPDGTAGKWQVSVNGGSQPLFESVDLITRDGGTMYDVAADGERFVTISPVEDADEEAAPPTIRVVENWYEEYRDREQ